MLSNHWEFINLQCFKQGKRLKKKKKKTRFRNKRFCFIWRRLVCEGQTLFFFRLVPAFACHQSKEESSKEPTGKCFKNCLLRYLCFKLKKKYIWKSLFFRVATRFKPATLLLKNSDKGICKRFWPQIYLDIVLDRYFWDRQFFRNTFSGYLQNKHLEHFFIWMEA